MFIIYNKYILFLKNNKKNNKFLIKNIMGRPKGSLNKSTIAKNNGGGVSIMHFDKQIENAPIIRRNEQYGIIQYGVKNLYPYDLINLYNTSVTHKACCDFATNAICGEGLDWDAMKLKKEDIPNPSYQMGWNEFIRALAFDFSLYSAFAFQVIRNKDGKTYSFFPQPIETVRLEEMDEDGVINNAYLCKDWSATGKYPPIKIPMFGFQEDETIPMGVPYLFYHRQYNPVNAYYGLPTYSSAINAILAEAQYSLWDLKSITNGFCPAGAITLSNVETDEERQAIIDNITRLFTGAQNSNSVMISFRNNIEEKPIEFTPFALPSSNVNLYEAANERTINRIMAGWRITSKALIGFPVDSDGFSDSGSYMESAYALYNVNVANNNRREILDVINTCFKSNGIDVEIILKPLRYKIDDAQTTISSDTTSNGETSKEGEVEEREENTI